MSKNHGSAGKRWVGEKAQKWRAMILSTHPLCVHCKTKGLITKSEEADHIIPLEDGGTYDPSNGQGLCKECHKAKTAKDRGYTLKPQIGLDGWPIENK